MTTAGVALSVGTAAGIAAGPCAGAIVDRVGATKVIQSSNVAAAVGCALLLLARGPYLFVLAIFILSAAIRSFWAAFPPLMASIATPEQRRGWFGRIRSLRYAGLTAGQALAGAVLVLGQRDGLRGLVLGDGISYLCAFVLLAAATRRAITVSATPRKNNLMSGSYRRALADRMNVLLAGLNILATLLITAPLIAMPVLVIQQLHLQPWLPGLLAALSTLAVALPAFFAGRLLAGRASAQVLATAASFWALSSAAFAFTAGTSRLPYLLLPVGMILLGFGEAAYAPTADAVPLELAPPELAGRYTALHQLAWGVSGAVAPSLAAFLLTVSTSALWLTMMSVAIVLALAYRVVAPAFALRISST